MIGWLFDKLGKNRRQEIIRLKSDAKNMEKNGNMPAALDLYGKALVLAPNDFDLRLIFGEALQASGENESAELAYRYVILHSSDAVKANRALGRLLISLCRYSEACECFHLVLESETTDRADWISAALAAYFVFDFTAAHKYFGQAGCFEPLEIPERFMQGMALLNCGLLNDAEIVFLEASKLAPHEPKLLESLGIVRLMKGEWRSGFELYEYRHATLRRNCPDSSGAKWLDYISAITKGVPDWQGESLKGRRLLLWCEQGFGDSIMMLRLISELLVKWNVSELLLIGESPLERLAESIAGVSYLSVVLGGEVREDLSVFDWQCSLLSLPYLMKIEYDNMPGDGAWIKIPVELSNTWEKKLAKLSGIKVGLVWAGNPDLQFDSLRSVALAMFTPLFRVKDICFISLQQSPEARIELMQSGVPVVDFMSECSDFMDTAALIDHLDLVIAVDTAVAHLAGALHVPVWLLNRFESEWRWLRNKNESAWYPTMRIFNQTSSRNWKEVLETVMHELSVFVAHRKYGAPQG